VPVGDMDALAGRICELAASLNVFVGVCPRVREAGTVDAVERCWVLWVDVDGEHPLHRLAGSRPWPSIVVRTGSGGAHAYWPLREPLDPAHAQRANRRLALATGGDMNATDAARILRPPGTLNHKYDPPREVRCTRLDPDRFTAYEVVGHLPDSDHYRRVEAQREWRERHEAGEPDRVLDGLVRTVAQAKPGGRNVALYWAACRAVEHAAAGELDEQDALDVLGSVALDGGLGADEVKATITSAQRRGMQ
jgi:hypothetical protein